MSEFSASGGCNCGAVRYRLSAPPVAVVACHCSNCRKQSGAAYSVNLIEKVDALSIEGPLTTFVDADTDSGQPVRREFCGACGSPICSRAGEGPVLALKAGTLDDPSPYAPALHIWTASKLDWVAIPEGLPTFPGNPPRG